MRKELPKCNPNDFVLCYDSLVFRHDELEYWCQNLLCIFSVSLW